MHAKIEPALAALAVPIDSVSTHPRNPREGDVGAISESLRKFGQLKPIVVQRSSGLVVAGNHTWKAAKSLGWESIAAVRVDLDDRSALAYAIADNRTQELGGYDDDLLTSILTELASADALAGTGYDGDDVDALLAKLTPPDPQNGDAPADDVTEVWGVVIECGDEHQQAELLVELGARGLTVRALMS